VLDNQFHADRCREVEYPVAFGDAFPDQLAVRHAPLEESESRMLSDARQVFQAAGRKVVNNCDGITLRNEPLTEMRPYKPRASCDKRIHAKMSFLLTCPSQWMSPRLCGKP